MDKFFAGVHSTVLINLDQVMYALSDGYAGCPIKVVMRSGAELRLEGSNADMFRAAWRRAGAPVPPPFSDDESAAYSSQP